MSQPPPAGREGKPPSAQAAVPERPLPGSRERARLLLEVNNAVMCSLTRDALLAAVSKALHSVLPFDACALFLCSPETRGFRLLAVEGNLRLIRAGQDIDRDGSSVGWVFDRQQPLVRGDLERDERFSNDRALIEEGMHSHCVVPVIVRGASIGTLNVASRAIDRYSEDDASLLQEVAAQLALAVENMKAYEDISSLHLQVSRAAERSRALLEINNAIITSLSETALLASVSKALSGIVKFDRCAFAIYQQEKGNFRFLSMDGQVKSDYFHAGLEFAEDDSAAGWVYRKRQGTIRRDLEKEQRYANDRRLVAEGIRSYCVVPMAVRGNCVGTLSVISRAKDQYGEADAEFLQEVATQVALAVENTKAYEEIKALKAKIEAENVYLQEEILREHSFDEIVGDSPPLLEVLRQVEIVAPTDTSVMLYGETGTGKELLARAIHTRSSRGQRAMVTVNCGAISSGLVESELFGHVKGAFTGAYQNAVGRFELADGSSLFLDEVGELPSDTQVKLLRVLQDQEFQPVGSGQNRKVDVRVIAATNRNLEDDVRAGRFRSDLFYRLSVFPIRVPALRERAADVPKLALFFVERACEKLGKKIVSVSEDTLNHLAGYDWPGNIRELQNVIERGVVLCRGSVLRLGGDLLPIADSRPTASQNPASDAGDRDRPRQAPAAFAEKTLEEVQREHILRVLQSTGGVIDGPKGAARILALRPSTLRARMKRLGVCRPGH